MVKYILKYVGVFVLGIIITYFVMRQSPQCIPLPEGNYVMDSYFIFHDEDFGTRILERSRSGITSKVFIPGSHYHKLLTEMTNPEILNYGGEEILFMRSVHFDKDSIDIKPKFYKVIADELVELKVSSTKE